MTAQEELLIAFDDAWDHAWESIESTVKGVTDEEAHYQHSAYKDEPPEDGYPPAGTILWYLIHLPHCYKWYKAVIESRPEKPEEVGPPEAATVREGIANLKHYRDKLRDTIAALDDSQLEDKLFNGRTIAEQMRMSIRHDAWHSGQMVMARRLFRKVDV